MSHGLRWTYAFQPTLRPFTLGPGEKRQVPAQDYIFKAPEGALLMMGVAFDSPYGGFSMLAEPSLDIEEVNTVNANIAAGLVTPTTITYARVPPDTPPGIYTLHSNKEQPWVETCRLYVLNSDPVNSITCFGYGYIMVYLTEPRPDESIVPLKKMIEVQEMLSLYPEMRNALKTKMEEAATEFMKRMGLKAKLEVT